MRRKYTDDDDFDKKAYLKKLSAQIAKVRRSKGYSQDRLTLESGLARGTISKVERGTDPRASTLGRIAVTLGVPIRKLLDFDLE